MLLAGLHAAAQYTLQDVYWNGHKNMYPFVLDLSKMSLSNNDIWDIIEDRQYVPQPEDVPALTPVQEIQVPDYQEAERQQRSQCECTAIGNIVLSIIAKDGMIFPLALPVFDVSLANIDDVGGLMARLAATSDNRYCSPT
jgi:hypothetical protein